MGDPQLGRISFAIINDDAAEYCRVLFDSLNRQQDTVSIEFVFIDNCSSDNSLELAKAFGITRHYHFTDKIDRRGILYNKAVELCSGEYIIFSHSDIFLDEAFLKNVDRFIKENPLVDFVNFRQYYANIGFFGNHYIGFDLDNDEFVTKQLFERNFEKVIIGECSEACFMVKRQLFENHSFNNEYFQSIFEYDFINAIEKDNKIVMNYDGAEFSHYFIEWHEKIKTFESDKSIYFRNMSIVYILKKLIAEKDRQIREKDRRIQSLYCSYSYVLGRFITLSIQLKPLTAMRFISDAIKKRRNLNQEDL
ncbi:MAG TPA: glycosyltransferase [Spirochaetota bacterium]|nr:glycosyltransferase [Spirochaetota bacterium]HRT77459.1 glycosyltransferase [Spirochaetota bacterium]